MLVHGFAMRARLLEPLSQVLAERFRVHAFDLPGHGDSLQDRTPLYPEALVAGLAGSIPAGALWLGWSFGVRVALAAARVGLARALVLLSGSARFTATGGWEGVPAEALSALRVRWQRDPEQAYRQFCRLAAGGCSDARARFAVLAGLHQDVGLPVPGRLDEALQTLAEADDREGLPTLALPALWLVGERDPLQPVAPVLASAAAMPDGRAGVLAGGHFPFLDDPGKVASAIVDWFAGTMTR